jgi:hypothetical protein
MLLLSLVLAPESAFQALGGLFLLLFGAVREQLVYRCARDPDRLSYPHGRQQAFPDPDAHAILGHAEKGRDFSR